MRHLTFFIFLIFMVLVYRARAADFGFMNEKDKTIYAETVQSCRDTHNLLGAIANKNSWESFVKATGQSLNLTLGAPSLQTVQKASAQNLLSDFTADRLNSLGFIVAVKECFPNDERMQQAYVLSMMTADTLGKVPAILAMMYSFKISGFMWGKFATSFPKAATFLKLGVPAAMVVYAVLESYLSFKSRELTEYEKERIVRIKSGLKENTKATGQLVNDLANERIAELEKMYNQSSSAEEKAKISQQIQKIKAAQKALAS